MVYVLVFGTKPTIFEKIRNKKNSHFLFLTEKMYVCKNIEP